MIRILLLIFILLIGTAEARDSVASRTTVASRSTLTEKWKSGVIVAYSNSAYTHDLHEMTTWNGDMYIAGGQGTTADGRTNVYKWDGTTLSTAFALPSGYTTDTGWKDLAVFGSNLYISLSHQGNEAGSGEGDIYKWDGSTLTIVNDTVEDVCYPLLEWNNKLWAGCGTNNNAAGKLYSSTDGITWVLENTFTGYDTVRSFAVWNGKLWIGLRSPARLQSFDGTTYVDYGSPGTAGGCGTQIKDITVANGKLYLSCVGATIYSFDGSTFTLEYDGRTDSSETYHGVAASNGEVFIAMKSTNGSIGNNVRRLSNGVWSEVYNAASTISALHFCDEWNGYVWCSGSNRATVPMQIFKTKLFRDVVSSRDIVP